MTIGNRYLIEFSGTPASPNDFITFISASGRRLRGQIVDISGAGTTSAAQGLKFARSTGGTTPGGAITPGKASHSEQPAATFTTATTWAAQPTIEANGHIIGFNALGPGRGAVASNNVPAIEARDGENLSLRAVTGYTYQACKVSVVIEED